MYSIKGTPVEAAVKQECRSEPDRGGKMRQRDLSEYEKPAVKIFDNYSTRAYSGVAYTCTIVSDYSYVGLHMKCMAWVCMN